jgi:hypothetical protein
MLHHHTIGQVAFEHRMQREGEAEAHRLVLEARGHRQGRAWPGSCSRSSGSCWATPPRQAGGPARRADAVRPRLRAASVEPNRPGLDGLRAEMGARPGIAGKRFVDSVLRPGIDSEHDPELVGQRASEDDEALVNEVVHERRVRRPAGLLLQPARRVPLRPRAVPHDEEHGHPTRRPRLVRAPRCRSSSSRASPALRAQPSRGQGRTGAREAGRGRSAMTRRTCP